MANKTSAQARDLENGAHCSVKTRIAPKKAGKVLVGFVVVAWILSAIHNALPMLPASHAEEHAHDSARETIRFQVGDVRYLGRRVANPVLQLRNKTDTLATVFAVQPNDIVTASFVREKRKEYQERDDVFRAEFLAAIILHGADASEVDKQIDASDLPADWKTEWIEDYFPGSADPSELLRPGPYKIMDGMLYQAHCIHSDTNRAFVQSLLPSKDDNRAFTQFQALGDDDCTLAIPVASRLCRLPSACAPLDGIRIAAKDMFNVHGLPTSLNSRAFRELHSVQDHTASALSQLIAKGAQFLGKTQMSAYALSEHPTQNVESAAAFNPRGDGYQIPGGSSSGSASAVASYPWVDVALGTDTTGSTRIPALLNGVFSLRTSSNSVPTDGIVTVYDRFDTPGLFARDLEPLRDVASVWLKPTHHDPLPMEIIVPEDLLPVTDAEQEQIFRDFASDLATHAQTEVQRTSISERWALTAPVEERNLSTYLYNATAHGFYYAAYHSFDGFRASYRDRFEREPFISEVVRWIWHEGSTVAPDDHAEMNDRFNVFRRWFLDQFMSNGTNAIFVLPLDHVAPNYRDVCPPLPSEPIHGLRSSYLSPLVGAPELAVPISQIAYHSRISGNHEYLPVVASMMSAPHTDLQLINAALDLLTKSGRPTKVLTGNMTFELTP